MKWLDLANQNNLSFRWNTGSPMLSQKISPRIWTPVLMHSIRWVANCIHSLMVMSKKLLLLREIISKNLTLILELSYSMRKMNQWEVMFIFPLIKTFLWSRSTLTSIVCRFKKKWMDTKLFQTSESKISIITRLFILTPMVLKCKREFKTIGPLGTYKHPKKLQITIIQSIQLSQ